MRTFPTVAIAVMLVLALPALGLAGGGKSRVVQPARFAHLLTGWKQLTDAPVIVQSNGGVHSDTLAVNWPFPWNAQGGPASHLSSGRVLISVLLNRQPGRFAAFPGYKKPLRLPLKLAQAQRVAEDGLPSELRFLRSTGAYNVDIRIDFGDAHPSPKELAAAQGVLNGLVAPRDWPH